MTRRALKAADDIAVVVIVMTAMCGIAAALFGLVFGFAWLLQNYPAIPIAALAALVVASFGWGFYRSRSED